MRCGDVPTNPHAVRGYCCQMTPKQSFSARGVGRVLARFARGGGPCVACALGSSMTLGGGLV